MVFEILLLVGVIGFVAMAGMGFLHGGHSHGDGHSVGGAHGHAPSIGHHHDSSLAHADHGGHLAGGHSHHVQGHVDGHNVGREMQVVSHWGLAKLLPFLSPLNIFSMALGAGATGMLVRGIVPAPFATLAACAGALFFDLAIVRPLMGLMIKFGSQPSEGLEGRVATLAEACTSFDERGRGLVKLTLDGEIVQLLGTLDPHETTKVKKGDKLLVIGVDSAKGTCKVTTEAADFLGEATT